MARSEERTRFLRDVITTALEGGVGYWSVCEHYQWVAEDGTVYVPVRGEMRREPEAETYAEIRDTGEPSSDLKRVDVELIEAGLAKIGESGFRLNDQQRSGILLADRESDAGMIDSDDADAIVQAGLFGEIVYG